MRRLLKWIGAAGVALADLSLSVVGLLLVLVAITVIDDAYRFVGWIAGAVFFRH